MPLDLVGRIIGNEKGASPDARNPRSSATGDAQFVDRTWLEVLPEARPDLVAGKSRDEILAMRTDPQLSREMAAYYAQKNQGLLGAAGVPVNDGTTYLAHFAGPQGAIKVLQADPTAPVGGILGDKVVAANPFLANMTAGDLAAWANKKMGASAAPAVPQAVPAAPQPAPAAPSQPMGILPTAAPAAQPAQQGLLAQAPQQSPGLLGAQNQAPPDLEDLASLLQPQFRQMAPKRGLPLFRG